VPANEKSVEVRNGVTFRYAEYGKFSGLPLLLLPGLGDSWRSFEPLLEHLPESIRAFALTLRGMVMRPTQRRATDSMTSQTISTPSWTRSTFELP
jgi:hypothetical protein